MISKWSLILIQILGSGFSYENARTIIQDEDYLDDSDDDEIRIRRKDNNYLDFDLYEGFNTPKLIYEHKRNLNQKLVQDVVYLFESDTIEIKRHENLEKIGQFHSDFRRPRVIQSGGWKPIINHPSHNEKHQKNKNDTARLKGRVKRQGNKQFPFYTPQQLLGHSSDA